MIRSLFSLVTVCLVATFGQAGPFRNLVDSLAHRGTVNTSAAVKMSRMTEPGYAPAVAVTPAVTTGVAKAGAVDALDEVNAKRASRGLRPYVRDEALTQGAMSCASYRASYGIKGHIMGRGMSDYSLIPGGAGVARATGCAAAESWWGWLSCCTYDNYTYAGAAWVMGADGRRYMHLVVR